MSGKSTSQNVCTVFILDEASILSRYGLENIDAKLRELHNNNEVPFGGAVWSIAVTSDGAMCQPV